MGWLAELNVLLTNTTRALHSMRLYSEMLRRAGASIRPGLFTVLTRIGELEPARVSDVAENTGYDQSTVSRHVTELVGLGYIARSSDASDGRVVMLTVTDDGRRTIDAVFDAWEAYLGEITADWSDADCGRFLRQLRRFATAITASTGEL